MARYVKSRVVIKKAAVKALTDQTKLALELTAEQLLRVVRAASVIPRKEGTLEGEGTFVDDSEIQSGHVYIVSSTPYARRLYYHPEYNFHTEPWEDDKGNKGDGNPNARGKWYTEWLPGGSREKEIPKWFQIFCRRLL
ncbi:MAG: hypothetical protein Q4F11_06025 [Eubacteriales bacterium]|nr:hypothetical protein [Eubacteriales bacterium]